MSTDPSKVDALPTIERFVVAGIKVNTDDLRGLVVGNFRPDFRDRVSSVVNFGKQVLSSAHNKLFGPRGSDGSVALENTQTAPTQDLQETEGVEQGFPLAQKYLTRQLESLEQSEEFRRGDTATVEYQKYLTDLMRTAGERDMGNVGRLRTYLLAELARTKVVQMEAPTGDNWNPAMKVKELESVIDELPKPEITQKVVLPREWEGLVHELPGMSYLIQLVGDAENEFKIGEVPIIKMEAAGLLRSALAGHVSGVSEYFQKTRGLKPEATSQILPSKLVANGELSPEATRNLRMVTMSRAFKERTTDLSLVNHPFRQGEFELLENVVDSLMAQSDLDHGNGLISGQTADLVFAELALANRCTEWAWLAPIFALNNKMAGQPGPSGLEKSFPELRETVGAMTRRLPRSN